MLPATELVLFWSWIWREYSGGANFQSHHFWGEKKRIISPHSQGTSQYIVWVAGTVKWRCNFFAMRANKDNNEILEKQGLSWSSLLTHKISGQEIMMKLENGNTNTHAC